MCHFVFITANVWVKWPQRSGGHDLLYAEPRWFAYKPKETAITAQIIKNNHPSNVTNSPAIANSNQAGIDRYINLEANNFLSHAHVIDKAAPAIAPNQNLLLVKLKFTRWSDISALYFVNTKLLKAMISRGKITLSILMHITFEITGCTADWKKERRSLTVHVYWLVILPKPVDIIHNLQHLCC